MAFTTNVQDRIPTYPGRVKMTPVAGQANTYDMVRADSPVQEGTPINKALFDSLGNVGDNLLLNWYFGNPVNQKGLASYTNTFGIDRWRLSTGTTMTLESGGIRLSNGWGVRQVLSHTLPQNTYTFSLLITEATKDFYIAVRNAAMENLVQKLIGANTTGIVSLTYTGDALNNVNINLVNKTDMHVKVVAAKLEVGDKQTLAHQDENGNWVLNEIPVFAAEYAKCVQFDKNGDTWGGLYGPFSTGLAAASLEE